MRWGLGCAWGRPSMPFKGYIAKSTYDMSVLIGKEVKSCVRYHKSMLPLAYGHIHLAVVACFVSNSSLGILIRERPGGYTTVGSGEIK